MQMQLSAVRLFTVFLFNRQMAPTFMLQVGGNLSEIWSV